MKNDVKKPICPKCKKPMQLWAVGRTVRHFHCKKCVKSKLVDKEGYNND